MSSNKPACFGEDDCSSMMLATCPFANECSEEANKHWVAYTEQLQKQIEIDNIRKQLNNTMEKK